MNPSGGWWLRFPPLATLDDPAWLDIRASAKLMSVPAGTTVFHAGDACQSYLLVLDGSVRVQKLGESGREITLYRVEGGDSCVLTTSCLMANEHYPAEGVTETEVTAVAIPVALFQRGLDESPGFRRFVFTAYSQRISDLIVLVESVAFGSIPGRLAQRLLELSGGKDTVDITHHALSAEIGTAREVVSRQLKEFERQGLIRLQRGRIEVCDRDRLAAVA